MQISHTELKVLLTLYDICTNQNINLWTYVKYAFLWINMVKTKIDNDF